MHIGKFYKIHLTIVRFSFFPRIVKRSIGGFRIKAKVKIKIKPLICQSKANLKAEFALVNHVCIRTEMRKMLVRGWYGHGNSMFYAPFCSMIFTCH